MRIEFEKPTENLLTWCIAEYPDHAPVPRVGEKVYLNDKKEYTVRKVTYHFGDELIIRIRLGIGDLVK